MLKYNKHEENDRHYSMISMRIETNFFDDGNQDALYKAVAKTMCKKILENRKKIIDTHYTSLRVSFVFDCWKVNYCERFMTHFNVEYLKFFLEVPEYYYDDEKLELRVYIRNK